MTNKILLIMGMLLFSGMAFSSGYFMAKSQVNTTAINQPSGQVAGQQVVQPTVSLETIKGLWDKNLIKFGKGDNKLLLVEVSDPSCPFCHVAGGDNKDIGKQMGQQFILKEDGGTYVAPVTEMKKLVDSGKADMVWIYSNGHGNGEMATKAMYCAFDQGKFWQAHSKLMSSEGYTIINETVKNDKTKAKDLVDFIGKEVDSTKMLECLNSGKYDGRINEEQALSTQLGVNGTPGFFVNTTNFAGAYSWTEMESVAKQYL